MFLFSLAINQSPCTSNRFNFSLCNTTKAVISNYYNFFLSCSHQTSVHIQKEKIFLYKKKFISSSTADYLI